MMFRKHLFYPRPNGSSGRARPKGSSGQALNYEASFTYKRVAKVIKRAKLCSIIIKKVPAV